MNVIYSAARPPYVTYGSTPDEALPPCGGEPELGP
jgi:hypothetical protein